MVLNDIITQLYFYEHIVSNKLINNIVVIVLDAEMIEYLGRA